MSNFFKLVDGRFINIDKIHCISFLDFKRGKRRPDIYITYQNGESGTMIMEYDVASSLNDYFEKISINQFYKVFTSLISIQFLLSLMTTLHDFTCGSNMIIGFHSFLLYISYTINASWTASSYPLCFSIYVLSGNR